MIRPLIVLLSRIPLITSGVRMLNWTWWPGQNDQRHTITKVCTEERLTFGVSKKD